MIKNAKVSHIGLFARDPEALADWYCRIAGLEPVERGPDGSIYLRTDANHHCLILYPKGEGDGDVHHVSFEISGADELEQIAEAIDKKGQQVSLVKRDEAGQGKAIEVKDPDGRTVEICTGIEQLSPPKSPAAIRPVKLGHFTFLTTDIPRLYSFYNGVLGFRPSDWLEDAAVWTRCNVDHHGVTMIRSDRAALHHQAFELLDWSEIRRTGDWLLANDIELLFGPGRHGPGLNLFSYFLDSEGNMVEFFADMQRIYDDAAYQPKVWKNEPRSINQWGPAPPPGFL